MNLIAVESKCLLTGQCTLKYFFLFYFTFIKLFFLRLPNSFFNIYIQLFFIWRYSNACMTNIGFFSVSLEIRKQKRDRKFQLSMNFVQ